MGKSINTCGEDDDGDGNDDGESSSALFPTSFEKHLLGPAPAGYICTVPKYDNEI